MFQAHFEAVPRRCTEAQGFPKCLWASPACWSAFSSGLNVPNMTKGVAHTSCHRDLCQRPKSGKHMDLGQVSDTCPMKCCSARSRYHHRDQHNYIVYSTPLAGKVCGTRCWLPQKHHPPAQNTGFGIAAKPLLSPAVATSPGGCQTPSPPHPLGALPI